jgi:hypothetical protein
MGEERRGEKSSIQIELDRKTKLMADSNQWILVQDGRYQYFSRLDKALQAWFDLRVRGSRARTVQELADNVTQIQKEIMDKLAPFCSFSNGKICIVEEDLKTPGVAGSCRQRGSTQLLER